MSALGVPGRHNSLEASVARRQEAAGEAGGIDTSAPVQFLPAAAADPEAQLEAEQAFQERKQQLVAQGRRSGPLVRLAAFLVAVSRTNVHEGRAAERISESLQCGVVADLLGMSIDTLQAALVELERKGLVASGENGGLVLKDLAGLDELSAEAPGPAVPARDGMGGWAPL